MRANSFKKYVVIYITLDNHCTCYGMYDDLLSATKQAEEIKKLTSCKVLVYSAYDWKVK